MSETADLAAKQRELLGILLPVVEKIAAKEAGDDAIQLSANFDSLLVRMREVLGEGEQVLLRAGPGLMVAFQDRRLREHHAVWVRAVMTQKFARESSDADLAEYLGKRLVQIVREMMKRQAQA